LQDLLVGYFGKINGDFALILRGVTLVSSKPGSCFMRQGKKRFLAAEKQALGSEKQVTRPEPAAQNRFVSTAEKPELGSEETSNASRSSGTKPPCFHRS